MQGSRMYCLSTALHKAVSVALPLRGLAGEACSTRAHHALLASSRGWSDSSWEQSLQVPKRGRKPRAGTACGEVAGDGCLMALDSSCPSFKVFLLARVPVLQPGAVQQFWWTGPEACGSRLLRFHLRARTTKPRSGLAGPLGRGKVWLCAWLCAGSPGEGSRLSLCGSPWVPGLWLRWERKCGQYPRAWAGLLLLGLHPPSSQVSTGAQCWEH